MPKTKIAAVSFSVFAFLAFCGFIADETSEPAPEQITATEQIGTPEQIAAVGVMNENGGNGSRYEIAGKNALSISMGATKSREIAATSPDAVRAGLLAMMEQWAQHGGESLALYDCWGVVIGYANASEGEYAANVRAR